MTAAGLDDAAAALARRNAEIRAGFGPAERLLYLFCKDPARNFVGNAYGAPAPAPAHGGDPLAQLREAFPDLEALIRGRCVLDYGCGDGRQAIAMARRGAAEVLGVDINERILVHARSAAADIPNVTFSAHVAGRFDVVVSLDSFEHFPDPEANLAEMASALAPGGCILVAFGQPWWSPWGAHMRFMTNLPWVNLFFSERTVNSVRRLYREGSGPLTYAPGLNQMSLARFERVIGGSGLAVERLSYRAIKNLPLVARIPLLRELLVGSVACLLRRPAPG